MPQFMHVPPQFSHRPPSFMRRPDPVKLVIMLVFGLFWAGVAACFLLAAHRISKGLIMSGRAAALEAAGDSMTDEEKRAVAEHLRREALHGF